MTVRACVLGGDTARAERLLAEAVAGRRPFVVLAPTIVAGKITLAVRLGDAGTRVLYQALLGVAAVMTLALMRATPWCALGLLAVPLAVKAARPVRSGAGGRDLSPVLRDTGMTMLVWSVAVAAALVLH